MKLKNIILLSGMVFFNTACSDFLELEPLSNNTDANFFTAENQLAVYCNEKYSLLPSHGTSSTENYGFFTKDINSDNQTGVNANDKFMPQRIQVPNGDSYANHSKLRDCNRFLSLVQRNIDNGTLANSATVQQYMGEMLFFRAYIYFNYLKSFGDFPILNDVLNDGDYTANVEANKRKPRNEVARFILSDLDDAISRLLPRTDTKTNHRLNKESAKLFKSIVALYEASWETYHKGTARVPGGPEWPGGTFSGNLDTEIAFFLTEAMNAAKDVAESVPALEPDYAGLFNKTDYSTQKEILLWRMYSAEANVSNYVVGTTHGYDDIMGINGGEAGYTRSLVETFLMKDGLPIYKSSAYKGDVTLGDVAEGRDERLRSSLAKPGDKIIGDKYFTFPALTKTGSLNITPTGYILRKGWMDNNVQINYAFPLSLPIYRVAEAYLNYMEADYMKNGSLDEYSKKYWKALRTRAGVNSDFQLTIDNTDLSKENDLAKYSGTSIVDKTLYNIRRERRSEFIAEGRRLDDLYRWRSLDMMKNYQIEGFNYWDENYKNYPNFETGKFDTPYIRPFWNNAIAKNGYNFEEANYLSPLSYDVFRLSTPIEGGDVSTSVVYQNPGWPVQAGAYAIKK